MSDLPDLAIPTESTWELAEAARRPAIEDVGGALLLNHPDPKKAPVKTGEMITAEMGNQWEFQALAAGRMISSAKLTIDFDAAAPFIDVYELARRDVTIEDDFALGDGGAGITTIEWLSSLLPPMATEPLATVNGSTTNAPAVRVEKIAASDADHTKIRVTTWDGAVKTDLRVTVWI